MAANHSDNITATISLSGVPLQRTNFGTVLYLVAQATNSLNGDRVVAYTTAADAEADNAAGYISAATYAVIVDMFSQQPAPSTVLVGRVDLVGGETYPQGYTAVKAVRTDFYAVCCDDRTGSVHMAMAAVIETERRIFVAQSDDADWLTTGLPSAYSGWDAYERSVMMYYDTDATGVAESWAANRLAWNADEKSSPWHCALRSIAAMSSLPTDTQKGFLDANNANHGLPYGGFTFYVDPGYTATGRPVYEIISVDWLVTRIEEDVAALIAGLSDRGDKLPISEKGQLAILGKIKARLRQGIDSGHFADNAAETRAVAVTITDADRTAFRLRFNVFAMFEGSTRKVSLSFYFTRTPVSSDS